MFDHTVFCDIAPMMGDVFMEFDIVTWFAGLGQTCEEREGLFTKFEI
jgi:hypothetical protein